MARPDELTFLEFLNTFRRGSLITQLDAMLSEVLTAMVETGGDGSITLSLPLKRNKGGQIECTPKLKAARPRAALGTGIYYATEDGHLTRSDPGQMDMLDELEPRRSRGNDN
ncbi:MAG: hypothetical protein COW55_01825 [Rhodobacteraceae bacterium CG17_big_fil_post_rev_8_21_14_2_50_65_11]|nr:MAG: hypothetical protein COW55_01825 [Rhodobacteraceae bacterium CG17_big_fil_post_rev_8_21_14_2_50_65_11]